MTNTFAYPDPPSIFYPLVLLPLHHSLRVLNILATLSLRESLVRFCAELFYGTVLGTVIASSIANLAELDPTRSLKMRLLSKGQFMPKL